MSPPFFSNAPVPVVGWGRGWLVMNKPNGMSIHNDPGKDLCSALNRFLQTNPKAAREVAFDAGYGIHPVHRLDKETSGVILLSCKRDVVDSLSRQFAQGTVVKDYLALVHGHAAAKGSDCWQWPLTPKATGRRNPQGQGRRIPCRTQVRLIRHSRHYSLIACRLDTGRTHQIRRHATLAGHPMVGDRRYGSLRACRYLEKHHDFKRLALHAAGISFQPPGDPESRLIEAPVLPLEIRQLLDADGQKELMERKGQKRKRGG